MKPSDVAVILKRFDSPDETKVFEKGRFEIIRSGRRHDRPREVRAGLAVVRARRAVARPDPLRGGARRSRPQRRRDGGFRRRPRLRAAAGEAFYIPPIPHDSWVVGDEPVRVAAFPGRG